MVCVVCDVSTGEGVEPSIAFATGDVDTLPPLVQILDSTKCEHFAAIPSISLLLHEQRYLSVLPRIVSICLWMYTGLTAGLNLVG